MTVNLTTQNVGSRVYIVGNSYPIRAELKSAGCHWDGDRRQWWIGRTKAAAVETIVAKLNGQEVREAAGNETEIMVRGKASYKGRTYYVRWAGVTNRGGYAMRLVSRDGKIEFWAVGSAMDGTAAPVSEDQAQWLKVYQEPRSLESLRQYAEQARAARDTGECSMCERMMAAGRWAPYYGSGDYDDCPMCGRTYRELR